MKKIDLNVSKQNNVDTIRYDLPAADVYDDKAADKAAHLNNIMPIEYSDSDGKRSITVYAHADTNLSALYKSTLTKREVLCILNGIAAAFEIGAQGIPVSYIVKDSDYIYVDKTTYAVKCVLIPVKQEVMPLGEIPVFFRNVVSSMRFSDEDKDNYVAAMLTLINSDDFSVGKLKEWIGAELEKMGLFISKDNGLTNMNAGGVSTPKNIKINKMGVINNMQNIPQTPMPNAPMGQMPNAPMGQMPNAPMGQAPQMKPNAPMGQMPNAPMGQAPQMKPNAPMGQMPNAPMGQVPQMKPNAPMGQMPNAPMGQAPQMKPNAPIGQMPNAPMGQAPQMKPNAPMGQMPNAPMGQAPQMKPNAPMGQMPNAPMGQAPQMKPNAPMGQMPNAPMGQAPQMKPNAPMGQMPNAPMGQAPQMKPNAPMGQMPNAPMDKASVSNQSAGQGVPATQNGLMGQLGTKPVPHIVRKKTGEIINITKPEFTIGKSKTKADYAVEDNTAISRVHCIIIQKDGVNYIKDNNSTNHTYINGVELQPGKELLLKNKTTIQLGDEEFTFLLRKGE